MATPLPLESDGIVETLYHYLWTTSSDLVDGSHVSIPSTILYHGMQPVVWYFTSRKSGHIKRKHRANLTPAHIEHSFSKRKTSTDIVAYYVYMTPSRPGNTAIEYFNMEALGAFLSQSSSFSGLKHSSGILQQLVLPKGAHNSTLRAIWSPKLCLLERRENVHAIHDPRFSVYERAVTFEEGDGIETLSRSEPVRGSLLPHKVQQLCERIVDNVSRVSYHKYRIARMVVRLQVDADDRLWLLWCSSLRLHSQLPCTTNLRSKNLVTVPLDLVSDVKVPTFAFAATSKAVTIAQCSMTKKEVKEGLRPGQTQCVSCAQVVASCTLLSTTYKAIVAHFDHVLKFLRKKHGEDHVSNWPPDHRLVQQAGGVGFGMFQSALNATTDDTGALKARLRLKRWQGRDVLIPPVLQYLHPTLKAHDFVLYRQDPIFLHKTVEICQRCCLVYADYATASLESKALGRANAPELLRPFREKLGRETRSPIESPAAAFPPIRSGKNRRRMKSMRPKYPRPNRVVEHE